MLLSICFEENIGTIVQKYFVQKISKILFTAVQCLIKQFCCFELLLNQAEIFHLCAPKKKKNLSLAFTAAQNYTSI